MKIETIRILKRAFLLPALFGILTVAGCTQDKEISPGSDGQVNEVTITVNIPATQVPTMRSIADENGEAVVSTIDVLVFQNTPAVLVEHVEGRIIAQSATNADNYQVQFLAVLPLSGSAATIVLVANAATETTTAIVAAGGEGTATKPGILSRLTYASSDAGGVQGWKWKAESSSSYTPIPMYGETTVSSITFGMNIDNVYLTRMLARIDVENIAQGFDLLEVQVVNYNTAGYIAPAWDVDGTLLGGLPETGPTILSTANPQWGEANAMVYDYGDYNSGDGMFGEIYTYEAAATTGIYSAEHTKAACLLLKGTYKDNDYYYRVDFTNYENTYMPLWRNHRYIVIVEAVKGIGYATAGEALQSLGMINNLKTALLVVDERGITSIVYNGQYYLGISQDEFTFSSEARGTSDTDNTLSVITNYPTGWKVGKITDVSGNNLGWLSTGVNSGLSHVVTAVKLILDANTTHPLRIGCIHLNAGNLTHEVTVNQNLN